MNAIEQTRALEPWAVNAASAANLLGISRAHFLRLRAAGNVPEPVRIGRRVLWRIDELRDWLESGCSTPAARARGQGGRN